MNSEKNCHVIADNKTESDLGNSPKSDMSENSQIKVFILGNKQYLESSLFRLEKGTTVQFHLCATLFGKKINFYINFPLKGKDFDRNSYQLLKWKIDSDEEDKNTFFSDTNAFACLTFDRAGTFHYYFTEENNEGPLGSGYFLVDPVLSYGQNKSIALDSIKCQTVLAKSLGPFEEWENRLKVSLESGYNAIHFTPLQELGGSNSSYSLKDQLRLNPLFSSGNCSPKFDDVAKLLKQMREEWRVLSIGDVVLNHTANESPWLESHPECTYNMITAPHLIPAAILDGYLHVFSKEVAEGKFVDKGIPDKIFTHDHLNAIKHYLEVELIPQIRLHEFYTCDVETLAQQFLEKAKTETPNPNNVDKKKLVLITEPIHGRNLAKVDLKLALELFNVYREDVQDEELRLVKCVDDFKKELLEINSKCTHEITLHLTAAINNCIATMNYFRVQDDGPKIKEITEKNSLLPRYFTGQFSDYNSVEEEVLHEGQFIMAHNGWVMNSDPLKNFADSDSNVYLRRELIVWGDSVKLRYGNSQSDCPFLWEHMKKYVEMTAMMFDGIRLDNCHSTPLPVAEYLLDCARRVRPDLYVVAELFTNSDVTDNIFVNRLGITSLVREAMSAWDSHELGRLIHRYGGEAVGSFCKMNKTQLLPSIPHALFYDVTHDNPNPIEKKSVFYLIPTAALVSMACCGIGSSRGFDELVPHHIHVVDENRLYPSWTSEDVVNNSVVNKNVGIIAVKKALNKIHEDLSEGGFTQIFVDQMNDNIIAVTRHNPHSHENLILVSHTVFFQPSPDESAHPNVRNLKFEGELCEILLEANIFSKNNLNKFSTPGDFQPDEKFINGLKDYQVFMEENLKLDESNFLREVSSGDGKMSEFEFKKFYPGSIVILRTRPHRDLQPTFDYMRQLSESFCANNFDRKALSIVSELNLSDLNYALYRCSEEDGVEGTGAYVVPGYAPLVFCGLQGFDSVLFEVRLKNDLGHPICENLRRGDWILDYISGRLKAKKGTVKLGNYLEEIFNQLRLMPRYLIPRYFDVFIRSIYYLLIMRAFSQMSEFVRNGSTFVRYLALGSVQCVGYMDSAPLPPFSATLLDVDDERKKITMCAGLPHFTTGYMRSWGRDTFIALNGLLLLTGRFEEARFHILGYGACLCHGLIPNLLDGGVKARFNCRDAVWWWLYSIILYVLQVPEGKHILKDRVLRIFPNKESSSMDTSLCEQPLYDVMQEALVVHFKGLKFRERNAGPEIDAHMTDEGFNNEIGIDPVTGFVFGGNEFNCGTWMDKMGSDPKTGNRGKPATPRDGSAIELVALCKAVISKLRIFHKLGIYPYSGVEKVDKEGQTVRLSFEEWEEKISANFEKFFWIPQSPSPWEKRPDLIHRREIYKDSVGASQPWADYQFRCNFLIALVVAPELVDPCNAWKAIKKAEEILLGPLGMKTLDPADWNYRGNYDNDDNSGDPKTSHGFNYHQGPEWLWPVGFFLRAKLYFSKAMGKKENEKAIFEIRSYLGNHYQEIFYSPWRGLPELTNENGTYCPGSCRVQAWSMGCILEVLWDLYQMEKENQNLQSNGYEI